MRNSLFLTALSLCLFSLPSAYAEESSKNYEIIEDKATLPIMNPSLAERKVLKLQLKNGLQVYLISDPGAEQSAAALAVEVGSWRDPKEYPGMAHFLEHMLFMGTKAYPKEFEYMQFITDNGGMVNAYTATDRTVYMFSVNNEGFEEALDRFSHFFIDPLFLPSCIGRELHAVDQEHSKNIEHDGWREYMILKETGNPNHPNAAFSTGNAKTLSGIPQSALKEWYQKHYVANRMHLVITSPLPMEKLTALATQDFAAVQSHADAPPAIDAPMTSPQQVGHMIYIKPIKDLRRLSLSWEIPEAIAVDNERRAPELIAYILSNNSQKSLLEELKREKIAENLYVTGDRFSKDTLLFRIDIDLTQQGVAQIDTAILRCFQAIARLKEKGIPTYLFDEMKRLAQIDYQYQSRDDAFSVAMRHADDMVNEDLQTYPEKTLIPTTYDPTFLSSFIQSLTPQNCLFFVQADPATASYTPDKKEHWMNAEYAIKEIPLEKLNAWSKAGLNPLIDLPPANPYIPTKLALVQTEQTVSATPSLIVNEPLGKVYFAADNKYLVPELSAIFNFKSPQIDGTAKKITLMDLYIKALSEKLSSTLFFAKTAGLHPSFSQRNLKLTLSVDGYSEKAPLLLKTIFQNLKTVAPSAEQFEIYKQTLVSYYDNSSKELPVRQGIEILSSLLYNDAPMSSEKLKALKAITYEEFLQFSKQLFKTSYVEGMVYGNLLQGEAEHLWSDLKSSLGSTPFVLAQQPKKQVLVLPEKHGPYLIQQMTERQGNGVILLLEQGNFSFEKRASQQILGKGLQEGFFDTLRTKQQTAYIAKAWDMEVERQLLQFFAVQSSTHNPADLLARFELFIEDFNHNIEDRLSRERFERMREMQIVTLKKPPENLPLMGQRLNTLAFEYEGNFSWFDTYIQALTALSYEQFTQDAHDFLARSNQRRIAILMEGVLHPDNDFRYEHVTQEDIRDLGTYVTWK